MITLQRPNHQSLALEVNSVRRSCFRMTLRMRKVSREVRTIALVLLQARTFRRRGHLRVLQLRISSFGKPLSRRLQHRIHHQTTESIVTVSLRRSKQIRMLIMRYLQLCSCLTGTQEVQ